MAAHRQPSDGPPRIEPWAAFVTAQTAQAYFGGWLEIVCTQFPEVRTGVLLVHDDLGQNLLPAAIWPATATDLSRMGPSIQRALAEGRGLTELIPAGEDGKEAVTRITYPVLLDGRPAGAVALETLPNPLRAQQILRHLHWGLGWVVESLQRRGTSQSTEQAARSLSVLESVATALRPGPLRESLFEIANDVARKLGAARVGIGLAEHGSVRLAALSDAAWVERSSTLGHAYTQAMEEALDIGMPVVSPPAPAGEGAPAPELHPRHLALRDSFSADDVATVPLKVGVRCVGLITLEWRGERRCKPADLLWLEAFAGMLPAIIEDKRRAQQGAATRALESARAGLARLFGPRHLTWKAASALVLLVAALLALVQVDYRVAAKTVIEGEVQRVVAAPFEGFIARADARPGDTVQAGQPLAHLEDRELKAELAKWTSERDQHERKLREAMAAHELSTVRITEAQLRQAEAQVSLFQDRIARAAVTAPFAGVVVSGDLSQMVGSPVEQGKKLFEIAPLQSYRVILQVDEREIRRVAVGQKGELLVAGIAGEPLPFTVSQVTPVATAQDGRNYFRVEARLPDGTPRLRPGMEGVGKIGTGDENLWTVLTHGFTHWLRLALWNWMP